VRILRTQGGARRDKAAAWTRGLEAGKAPRADGAESSGTNHAHRSVPLLHDPTPPRKGMDQGP